LIEPWGTSQTSIIFLGAIDQSVPFRAARRFVIIAIVSQPKWMNSMIGIVGRGSRGTIHVPAPIRHYDSADWQICSATYPASSLCYLLLQRGFAYFYYLLSRTIHSYQFTFDFNMFSFRLPTFCYPAGCKGKRLKANLGTIFFMKIPPFSISIILVCHLKSILSIYTPSVKFCFFEARQILGVYPYFRTFTGMWELSNRWQL